MRSLCKLFERSSLIEVARLLLRVFVPLFFFRFGRRNFGKKIIYKIASKEKKKSNISEHYSLSRSNEPYASTKTSKTRTKGIVDGNSAMKHG